MEMLFSKHLRTSGNLVEAWFHVRANARKSPSKEIRDACEDFEKKSHSKLQRIQTALLKKKYKFPLAEGILKDKKKREAQKKAPRPIVLADIEARVVQRALLQCLQPKPRTKLAKNLKTLNAINQSEINFGGTPKGGVPKALQKVIEALNDGCVVYYKSDIAAFFTKVPHQQILDFLLAETNDKEFTDVFRDGLTVQLKNADAIKEYLDLFPDNDMGVPQVSALSAMAGNIFLHEVDNVMKSISDVKFVRYIDDVIILGKSNEALQNAKSVLQRELKKRSLSLYNPKNNPDKAAEGHVRNGFEYLGCLIQKNQLEPGKQTKRKLLEKVTAEIQFAKRNIEQLAKNPKLTRVRQATFAKCIVNIDELVRGWANSFRFANDRKPFHQLDAEIKKLIDDFDGWFRNTKFATDAQRLRALGTFQLIDTEHKKIQDY
jgi:retron-type reverse transcriptase